MDWTEEIGAKPDYCSSTKEKASKIILALKKQGLLHHLRCKTR